jgi:O-succinylbenzoic acid--CoA ligase
VVGDRRTTYAELDTEADRVARRLAALGVQPGDRVATTLPPGQGFAALLHAVPRIGAVLVPLDPRDPVRVEARLTVEGPLEGPEAEVELRRIVEPEAVHSVIHTSGTTGRPKAVELTYGNHHASALASAAVLGVGSDDRWLCPLPLFHVGGLAVLLRAAIHGATALLQGGFDAERVKASLESGDATLVSLVPTMLHRLREAGLAQAPGLRVLLLGGGRLPDELIEWSRTQGLPVRATYGMTETSSGIAIAAPGERAGRPLPGVELRIAPDGEILVRGPMVAPAAAAEDGWLHTGDRGWLDSEGRLHVEGRLKDLIVTGGENVSPLEVEGVLSAHPAVADAAVAGLADPEWGEAVVAFVVLCGEAAPDELIRWCRERLAPHKVPKRVQPVDALPRDAAGKLRRSRL